MAEASSSDAYAERFYFGSDLSRPVAAAIDFGTTSTGFAYVFEDNRDYVHCHRWVKWFSDEDNWHRQKQTYSRAPTTVLLKEDKSFHSFGFDAERNYAGLCKVNLQKGWRYFHHFKTALNSSQKITRETDMLDTENKPMPALEVLSCAILYLKNEILREVSPQRTEFTDGDIMYVITVPASWSDVAIQLLREAATQKRVGINDDQLRLVLETEAASVFCALRRISKSVGDKKGQKLQPLPVGSGYIIVDIGGGTLDVSTHKIISRNQLHESFVARGSNKGGYYFNLKCIELLENIFGEDSFEGWKTTRFDKFLELERNIEEIKRKVSMKSEDVKLKIDKSLSELYGDDFDKLSMKYKAIRRSNILTGCIVLKKKFLKRILKEITFEIEMYLKQVFEDLPSIQTMFIIGDLAKSIFVRQYIEAQFPKCEVIVPDDPEIAVLKGAALLGNRPQPIPSLTSRNSRYSYGIGVMDTFVNGKHKKEYQVSAEGVVWCDKLFEKIIERGQILQYGQRYTKTAYIDAEQPETKHKAFIFHLFQSSEVEPMYVTNYGCRLLGGVRIHPPREGWPDHCVIKQEIIVGTAELRLVVHWKGV